jgi:hypothetical protein
MHSRVRDDGATVGVSDEQYGTVDGVESSQYVVGVGREVGRCTGNRRVVDGDVRYAQSVELPLEWLPAPRAVPGAMHEDDGPWRHLPTLPRCADRRR